MIEVVSMLTSVVALLSSGGARTGSDRCVIVDSRSVCVKGPSARNLPLVVYLHGYGGSGDDDALSLRGLATSRRFLYAAPDALADENGHREWRTGDVGFIHKLIEQIVATNHSDRKRVYLVGFSLGGFLALEFACTRPDAIAAAVSVSGTRFSPAADCRAGTVSTLQLHGQQDTSVAPAGGVGRRTGRRYLSARAAALLAAGAAGCATALTSAGQNELGARVERATSCRRGARVELWLLPGVAHAPDVPGLGGIIWKFLEGAVQS